MSQLTITKERVLAAAAKCSTAKATLQTLFPEVFAEGGFNTKALAADGVNLFTLEQIKAAGFRTQSLIQVRVGAEYANKSFFLDNVYYDWKLVTDKEGSLCLVPSLKPGG